MKFLSVMLMLSSFIKNTAVSLRVVGPDAPLVTKAGEDLVLPCSIQSNTSTVDMMVEWLRPDHAQGDRLVHLYEDHEDRNEQQFKFYRGRTSLFKEELQNGNASLKLSAVQPSDQGVYKCSVRDTATFWNDDIDLYVEVQVKLKVIGINATLIIEAGEDLVLPCSIQPKISAVDMRVEWSRLYLTGLNPLVHLYEDYKDRNEEQMESYRGRTSLFKGEMEKGNASLKLSAVQPSDQGVYMCLVETFVWREAVHVYIEVKGTSFHSWKIIIICIAVSAFILAAFSTWTLKDRFSKKDLSPAQCSVIAYMYLHSVNVRKDLDLKLYKTSEEGYKRLIPTIRICRKAQFASCNLSEKSIKTLVLALQSENSFLRELDLSKNDLQDSRVKQLSDGLKSSHCKLEILRLVLCNLNNQSCDNIKSVLETKNYLRELDLSKNDIQDSGVKQLSDGLKSSHCKLETLRLSACNFTGKSCEYFTSALKSQSSTLRELDLSQNDLQDSGVEKISDGLKDSHCKLEKLKLVLCNLGEKSCETLGSVLKLGNSLKELDLSINDLKDSGVNLICNGLENSHCKLEILRLSGCLVTEQGCSSLASALESNSLNLKELDLTYNHPGEKGEKLLCNTLQDTHCTFRVENSGEIWIKPNLRKYVCDITLDLNTAHTRFSLSEENRKVEVVKDHQPYPDHQDRFDEWWQVLSEECLPKHCYWEVEWSGQGVYIAVAYRGIKRKGRTAESRLGCNNISWCLDCSNNERYVVCHNNKRTVLSQLCSPGRIGVYFNKESDTLSFYTIPSITHTLTHLHTVHSTFTELLYAGFLLYPNSSVCV